MVFKVRKRFKAVLIIVAATAGLLWASTLPGELGLNEEQTRQELLYSFVSGNVPVHMVSRTVKAAAPAMRAKMVEGVMAWAKFYSETPAYAAAYAAMRTQNKPQPPEPHGSVDEAIEKERAKMAQQIEETKAMVKQLPADQQQGMEETIEAMTASMEQMYGDPEMRKFQAQMIEAQWAEEQNQYESSLTYWGETYPEDHRLLIARRLKAFLETSADVNYDAKLQQVNNKMRFADPQYEEKPAEWKLCYRTGREAVTAARAFATTWLASLPQSE